MDVGSDSVSVVLAADGLFPRRLRWRGLSLPVLVVERFWLCGQERRFRVCTPIGRFELARRGDASVWLVLRQPGWLKRAAVRLLRSPRYPLPPWRRRAFTVGRRAGALQCDSGSPACANGFALVRQ